MVKSRGFGPFREEWYSACSFPAGHKATCRLCQRGAWVNVYRQAVGSFVFDRWPNLWRAWANRPFFNKTPAWMREALPRLRFHTTYREWFSTYVWRRDEK